MPGSGNYREILSTLGHEWFCEAKTVTPLDTVHPVLPLQSRVSTPSGAGHLCTLEELQSHMGVGTGGAVSPFQPKPV